MIMGILLNIIIIIGLFLSIFWLITLFNTRSEYNIPDEYPGVTVIIPAYNEEEAVQRTIESCLDIEYPGPLTIIAVNDASTDDTLSMIQAYEDDIQIIDKQVNEGKAKALNTALAEVETLYFTVIDADSTVEKDSLKKAMKYFYTEKGEVGAVISKLKPDREPTNIVERVQLVEYMFAGLIRYLSAGLRLLHITPGVLSIYKTSIVKGLKGFDSNNVTEDFEMAVRLRRNDYLINYAPDSKVYTKVPDTFNQFLGQRLRWGRGFFRTIFTHNKIIFNKEKGLFGIYEFPMNIASPILFFIAAFILAYNIVRGMYEFFFKLIFTPDVIEWFKVSSVEEMVLSFNTFINAPLTLSLVFVGIFLFFVFRFYDYDYFAQNTFKKIGALIVYIFIFNYIFVYVFSKALYDEVTGIGYTWETKT